MMSELTELTRWKQKVDSVDVPDYIKEQNGPPFYCGTAFCGHHSMAAAAQCWKSRCDLYFEMKTAEDKRAEELRGDYEKRFHPELDPRNWPINRSLEDMKQEYIEKAARESGCQRGVNSARKLLTRS